MAPGSAAGDPRHRASSPGSLSRVTCEVVVDLDEPPTSVPDAYLRLHLLSHRLVRPNEANLEGLFEVLPNICWTSAGPVAPREVTELQRRARAEGRFLEVRSAPVEGRISQGVVVGARCDLGHALRRRDRAHRYRRAVPARSERGLGISLGDDCVVEAGLHLTTGQRRHPREGDGSRCKARELSGRSRLLFRSNSVTGAIEALQRAAPGIALNSELHEQQ